MSIFPILSLNIYYRYFKNKNKLYFLNNLIITLNTIDTDFAKQYDIHLVKIYSINIIQNSKIDTCISNLIFSKVEKILAIQLI